jgi:transcriptional regulator with XRE-family HTH domain
MELDDAQTVGSRIRDLRNRNLDDAQTVGSRIRDLRKRGYLTAAAFARDIGSTPQALSNWENGYKRIGLEEAWKICRATGVTLDWIFLGDDSHISTGDADAEDGRPDEPDLPTDTEGAQEALAAEPPLTISEAKRRLAASLGIDISSIKIMIET